MNTTPHLPLPVNGVFPAVFTKYQNFCKTSLFNAIISQQDLL